MEAIAALLGIIIMVITLGLMACFYIGMFAFVVFGITIWIMMLIDVVKRKFPNDNDRTTWILVVALTGWIGALIYYFIIKRPADQLKKGIIKSAQ